MYPAVWQTIVAGRYRGVAATLPGYCRYAVKGEEYPMIVADGRHGAVTGKVYLGVSPGDLKRLDIFEGLEYNRVKRRVTFPAPACGQRFIHAWVYVANAHGRRRLSTGLWDPDAFEQYGLARFTRGYSGFSRL